MTRKARIWVFMVAALIFGATVYRSIDRQRHGASLSARLEQVATAEGRTQVSCAELAAKHPLVLLALGQSNAGNHGELKHGVAEPVYLFAEGKCLKTIDPLPGGTGRGGSIWQRLPSLLQTIQQGSRPVLLSVIAVDATNMDDWTNPRSPLPKRLAAHVQSMSRQGLAPTLILWQQGEADARNGTGPDNYSAGLGRLATILNDAGTNAPIVLARTTLCQSATNKAIRTAIETTASGDLRFRLGPDTDTLSGEVFRDGCHLTARGLDSAAKMWATVIVTEASNTSRAGQSSSGRMPVEPSGSFHMEEFR